MARGVIYTCQECNKEFKRFGNISKERAHKFCSLPCYWENMKKKKECICETCGSTFVPQSHVMKLKYCSKKCMAKNKNWIEKQRQKKLGIPAWNKGKPNTWSNGDKSNFWKGGITPINKQIRASLEYEQWRIKIFERDLYTCQECGEIGGYLHADHIKPFAYFPELRFELDNGRTLCVDCHRKTNTYGYKLVKKYRVNNILGKRGL